MAGSATRVGRPREFDEDAVLDAAVDVFWEHGFSATTTRLLEAELGLKQSSIYNAFGSKADLMEAALDHYEERLDREVMGRIESVPPGVESLTELLQGLQQWVSEGGGCMLLNALADGSPDERIVTRASRYRARLLTIFTDSFSSGSREQVT